ASGSSIRRTSNSSSTVRPRRRWVAESVGSSSSPGSINSSYHVGLYAFSVWLVGLTAVCGAAAAIYAWWVGRDRPRAYFGLLLFLTGAVAGVFAAQDLLLFYAFFEAMLIPLYVLIGFWGG